MSLIKESFASLHTKLENREISVSELVDASLNRINEVDGQVHAFLTVNEDEARAQAKKLDEKIGVDGGKGALFGLPAGIKDNIITRGVRTTCASKLLENFTPVHHATVMEKLDAAESVSVGKLNMDEFAMGSSNENSGFIAARNPWHLDYVPGGSSGGSAAAVAAGEVTFALGSDTGGSIREPAAYCGVVGMKPTYSRVSRFGLVAFASSLDQIGPLTRSVEDNAHVLQQIAGFDNRDSTSANMDVPNYVEALGGDVKGMKIAVPKEYLGEGVNEDVRAHVSNALRELEKLGATWEEVSLPHSQYAVAAYYLIASSEASANLARFDGVRYGVRHDARNDLIEMYKKTRSEGLGDEVKRRIMLGTFALSSGYYDAYYKKAQQVRTLIKEDFDNVLQQYDVIIGPTAPTTAFKIGENIDDPLTMYANDILTIPVNLAGVPAISVPCGFSHGLPVGLQIIGKPFDERTVYKVAHAYEQATEHAKAQPVL
ncbi:aspartyl/glutamyl-tRNA(Asn/Gln) amidotransferase subunit A [Salsuginibacillus halophilus]|uniref:Glutamyl-tRNA(Gln) amidotransferase subunit A n=1 Tax=Salsuginibacillus halophilus TaxID=517424 RepID=A0A2P8HLG6_9BACI|nr:Asp-tRNA(Asn)/Glu-tRNA(Gln) amidotransferase subunit GatA [Salsuginibacillus halophilus]PSL47057.1 aspartyl/glutamyl-tRNA(Asn/Gln) amidotransferase subunit A [Salsuginibacillus halophilus]